MFVSPLNSNLSDKVKYSNTTYTYSISTANSWQYAGKSFTVPARTVCIANLSTTTAGGVPSGLGFSTSQNQLSGSNFIQLDKSSSENRVRSFACVLYPDTTFYTFARRNGTGEGTYYLKYVLIKY